MKFKRFWKLYDELRRLRRKVKVLEADVTSANQRYNTLWYKKSQEVPYDTMSVMLPNVFRLEADFCYRDMYSRPKAEYLHKRLTDSAKIQLVDDMIKNGYFRLVRDDDCGELYQIKLVK